MGNIQQTDGNWEKGTIHRGETNRKGVHSTPAASENFISKDSNYIKASNVIEKM